MHDKKLDYFVASGASGASGASDDYHCQWQGEGKLHSLIFAPYAGTDARARVIRHIESDVGTEIVRAGNLVNGLTIGPLRLVTVTQWRLASGTSVELEPGAVFAVRRGRPTGRDRARVQSCDMSETPI